MTPSPYPDFGVLLVDDEPDWLSSLALTLESCAGISNIATCSDSRQVMAILDRGGIGLVLLALAVIIIVSFYHAGIADFLSWTDEAESRLYRLGIFLAAALGGYGAVLAVFGLLLPGNQRDAGVRILPLFLMILGAISLFFYLLAVSFDLPPDAPRERLRPGETITI